jgi:hypothetical protein
MRMAPIRLSAKASFAAGALFLLALLAQPRAALAQQPWSTPDASGNINSTNTGNVGVGTGSSSPAAKLDVKGSTSDATAAAVSVRSSGNTNLLFVRNDGWIGFGTTAPVSLLNLIDTSTASVRGITLDEITTGTHSAQFGLRKARGVPGALTTVLNGDTLANIRASAYDGTSYLNTAAIQAAVNGTVATNSVPTDLYFSTGSSGVVERMRITSGGNVGIGTSTPASGLHVNNGYGLQSIRVSGSGGGIVNFYDTAAALNQKLYQWRSEGGTFRMALVNDTENTFAQQNILVANSAGNVGIGTSGPNEKLHVNGGLVVTGAAAEPTGVNGLFFGFSGGTTATIDAVQQGTDFRNLNVSTKNFSLFTWNGSAQVLGLYQNTSGNVGIGTAGPAYKLDVAGQVRSSSGGFVFPDGTSQATAAAPVSYGSTAGTAVQGNTSLSLTAGTGMSGGGTVTLGSGGSVTITNADRGSSQSIFKNVANGSGAVQFAAGSNNDAISFEGAGGTSVTFNAAAKKVVINSAAAQSSGWTDSGSSVSLTSGSASVGIGTATPSAKLDVASGYVHVGGACGGTLPNTQGAYLSWNQNCGTGETDLINHQGGGTGGFAFKNTSNGSTLNTLMSISANGDVSVSGNIQAKYQDMAEWVPADRLLPAGTVVVLDATHNNRVTSSSKSYDTRVAGVISPQPGITLGERGEGKALVATTGRVRVKVDATRASIQVGDLLVTSDVEGVAMKSIPVDLGGVAIHRPGTIIGKALEPLEKGTGEILVLLSLQ